MSEDDSEIERLIPVCKQMFQDKKNIEEILLYLRAESGRKTISSMVIANLLNIPINDAKVIVHSSDAWSDVKKRDETVHEDIISEIEKISKKK